MDGSEGGRQQQNFLHFPAEFLPGQPAGQPPLRLPAGLLLAPHLPDQLLLPHLHDPQQVRQPLRLQLQLQQPPRARGWQCVELALACTEKSETWKEERICRTFLGLRTVGDEARAGGGDCLGAVRYQYDISTEIMLLQHHFQIPESLFNFLLFFF